MKMICDVPDEVIKNVRMGTWCGSSVAEKMIANGIPLEQIRAEIKAMSGDIETIADVLAIIDKYKAETENKE